MSGGVDEQGADSRTGLDEGRDGSEMSGRRVQTVSQDAQTMLGGEIACRKGRRECDGGLEVCWMQWWTRGQICGICDRLGVRS